MKNRQLLLSAILSFTTNCIYADDFNFTASQDAIRSGTETGMRIRQNQNDNALAQQQIEQQRLENQRLTDELQERKAARERQKQEKAEKQRILDSHLANLKTNILNQEKLLKQVNESRNQSDSIIKNNEELRNHR